jgi:2-polyprenyl-3-methyl-5-hydroxy-6-metoxy-1,4-benzoquinol methylase
MTGGGPGPPRLSSVDPRPGPWRTDALVPRACPICAAEGEPRFVRPDGLVVRGCGRCGAWFVSPAPGPEQLRDFYRDYHRRHRVEAFQGTAHADRSRLPTVEAPAALAARIRGRDPLQDLRVRELASNVPLAGARVLDVGCGTGQLLWLLSSLGAEVTGLDVDPAAAAFVAGELGLSCIEGTIAAVEGAERFDLIVLQDLLEHVLEPREVLERAAELLRPGGVLYLWTPNATNAGRDAAPIAFRGDFEHLQFLSARTVALLADELGLELLHLESLGFLRTAEDGAHGAGLRRLLARLPGLAAVARVRAALRDRHAERAGSYHLLALLEKPR